MSHNHIVVSHSTKKKKDHLNRSCTFFGALLLPHRSPGPYIKWYICCSHLTSLHDRHAGNVGARKFRYTAYKGEVLSSSKWDRYTDYFP